MAFSNSGLQLLSVNVLLSINDFSLSSTSLLLIPTRSQFLSSRDEEDPITRENQTSLLAMMLPKNLNIYWVVASSVAIWFLFIHAPPFIIRRKFYQDIPMATHLAGAYTIYLACMFNTMFTPSTLHGKARPWHIWIGRVGMVSGVVSFVIGLYCAWWPYREMAPPLGFSIGITVGGVMQVLTQKNGYLAIKRFGLLKREVEEMVRLNQRGEPLEKLKQEKEAALRSHIYNMVCLFVVACGIPAGLRIADMLPQMLGPLRMIAVIVLTQVAVKPYGDTFIKSRDS